MREAEAHFGHEVGLLVFDTFNKGIAAGGGDEDKAKDQNRAAANLQKVQDQLPDSHIALIGHTGKDESRGARGSNAHLADVDLMIQLSINGDVRTATITMANDSELKVMTNFRLQTVTVDYDDDDEPVTTAIVADKLLDVGSTDSADSGKDKAKDKRNRLNPSQRRAMEMLERVLIEGGEPPPAGDEYPEGIKTVPLEAWREACRKGGLSVGGNEKSVQRVFQRAVKELVGLKRIGLLERFGVDRL